jgi:aldehyde:ferredoxin oxidoreductase
MYGMDTISCGATIAWAMDAFEAGVLTVEDTGGIELRFGDHKTMLKLVEMIAHREGFGALLAEGSARAAQSIGRGSQDLVVTVKKQEMPAHMPQVKRSLGLIYGVNPFGADHQSHEHDPSYQDYPERMAEIDLKDPQPADNLNDAKVEYALTTQFLYSTLDSVNLCQFVFGPSWQLYGPEQMIEAIQAVTGWDVDMDEVLRLGERRLNLMRAFNTREGLTRADDALPKKMFQPLKGGTSDGVALDEAEIENAMDTYFQMAGWDPEGRVTQAKLKALALDWVADLLAG